MAYCKSCGQPLQEDQKFCAGCGRPVERSVAQPGEATAATTPLPDVASMPPGDPSVGAQYPPAVPYPSGGAAWPPPQRRRSLKGLWIGLAAVVVIAVVACVLVFVVFAGGNGATGPEQAVERFFTAMEEKDLDAVLDVMDPRLMEGMPTGDAFAEVKEEMSEQFFDYRSVKISGLEMSTEMTSDTTATVTLTAGLATVTDSDGVETVEDVTAEGSPVTIDLVKLDGSWYLESSPFF